MKKIFSSTLLSVFLLTACSNTPINTETTPDIQKNAETKESTQVMNSEISSVLDYDTEVSSTLKDSTSIGFDYSSEMMFDQDFSTAWCSTGEDQPSIKLAFKDTVAGGPLGIVPGFARDESIYGQNNRVKTLRAVFDDGSEQIFDLKDKYEMQFLDFSDHDFKQVTLYIDEVYPGSKYSDTCISELDFWSDYVLEEDATAAKNFYDTYKAGDALRPNDIVSSIMVTDYYYKGRGAGIKYEPISCANSIYAPIKSELDYHKESSYEEINRGPVYVIRPDFDVHVFAEINQYGREGDKLTVKWLTYPIEDRNLMTVDPHQKWETFYTDEVEVFESCGGNLFAYSKLPESKLYQGGLHFVRIYRNGRLVGEQAVSFPMIN